MGKTAKNHFSQSRAVVSLTLLEYLGSLNISWQFVVVAMLRSFPYLEVARWCSKNLIRSLTCWGRRLLEVVVKKWRVVIELLKANLPRISSQLVMIGVKSRIYIMAGVLLALIGINLTSQHTRFERHEFRKELIQLNYFPAVPDHYFQFAKRLFDYGDSDNANAVLAEAANVLGNYNLIGLSILFNDQYQATAAYVSQRSTLLDELDQIKQKLVDAPYSVYLLTRKAEVEARLMGAELSLTVETIHWLAPKTDLGELGQR